MSDDSRESGGGDVRLELSGAIPGLLRRGSPVPAKHVIVKVGTRQCVVANPDGMQWDAPTPHLRLDLSDPTGRAHAAWWLAGRLYPDDGPYLCATVLPGRTIGPLGFGLSTTSVQEGERWRTGPHFECTDDLDPNDPRLLPDGSRLVDALALRLVCEHVAGGR